MDDEPSHQGVFITKPEQSYPKTVNKTNPFLTCVSLPSPFPR